MTDRIAALEAPSAVPGTGAVRKGMDVARVDGPAKVRGQARYAAEFSAAGLAYGVVVNTPHVRGRITRIDVAAALAVPGVLDVLTHANRPKMRSNGLFYKDMVAPGGKPFRPLYDDVVAYSGQPVALVVAETFEAARHAATLVNVEVDVEPHETALLVHLDRSHAPRGLKAGYAPPPSEKGDADAAFATAPHRVDITSYAGVEHHNPLELFASTVIVGDDGHMTAYDKTQGSQNSRWYVSHALGIPKSRLTVRNAYVGGAFGAGLRPQYQLLLAVMAAQQLQRSVRVVLTRQQMFTLGHRPETWQRVRLAADAQGRLQSIGHLAKAETSRFEDYTEVVVNWSGQLYACDNIKLGYELVDLDHSTPIDMRAPGATHGVHALEVAMDELSYAVGIDPLALRLANYAERTPIDDKPYSSKALRACYQQGAERFGWSRRPAATRATRVGTEYVGWGMATGTWDAMQMFARASAVLGADGRLLVSSAATDIGTGTYTVMSQIAADAMGLPMEHVTFQLGDSTLPVAPIQGGSSHVTTVGSAVQGACDKLKASLLSLASKRKGSPFRRRKIEEVEFIDGRMQLAGQPDTAIALVAVLDQAGRERVEARYLLVPDVLTQRKYTRATHSAVFCEVHVDEALGTVRVTRMVSAVAAGRIISARTARSQITGAMVWGIGHALLEETHVDHRAGRYMNHDLAEYHVAVNADIHDLDMIFVEEDDRIVSALGAKGVGEIGIVGVSAAISNAVFHAVGVRVRDTPITPDKVLAGLSCDASSMEAVGQPRGPANDGRDAG